MSFSAPSQRCIKFNNKERAVRWKEGSENDDEESVDRAPKDLASLPIRLSPQLPPPKPRSSRARETTSKTFEHLVRKTNPAIISRLKLLDGRKLQAISRDQKISAQGVISDAVKEHLKNLGGLHGIRFSVSIQPIDPRADVDPFRSVFHVTEYSGKHEKYVVHPGQLTDAIKLAYSNSIMSTKRYLPDNFRIAILKSLTTSLTHAFTSLVSTHLSTILETFYLEDPTSFRVDFYEHILNAIPQCRTALGITSTKFPYHILGRLSLIPYLADGDSTLSGGLDATMLLLAVFDALYMVGAVLGDGKGAGLVNELAGALLNFVVKGNLVELAAFYEH